MATKKQMARAITNTGTAKAFEKYYLNKTPKKELEKVYNAVQSGSMSKSQAKKWLQKGSGVKHGKR